MATLEEVQAQSGKPISEVFLVDELGGVGRALAGNHDQHSTMLDSFARSLQAAVQSPDPLDKEIDTTFRGVSEHLSSRKAVEMAVQCWIDVRLENPEDEKPFDAWMLALYEVGHIVSRDRKYTPEDRYRVGEVVHYVKTQLPLLKDEFAAQLGIRP